MSFTVKKCIVGSAARRYISPADNRCPAQENFRGRSVIGRLFGARKRRRCIYTHTYTYTRDFSRRDPWRRSRSRRDTPRPHHTRSSLQSAPRRPLNGHARVSSVRTYRVGESHPAVIYEHIVRVAARMRMPDVLARNDLRAVRVDWMRIERDDKHLPRLEPKIPPLFHFISFFFSFGPPVYL